MVTQSVSLVSMSKDTRGQDVVSVGLLAGPGALVGLTHKERVLSSSSVDLRQTT